MTGNIMKYGGYFISLMDEVFLYFYQIYHWCSFAYHMGKYWDNRKVRAFVDTIDDSKDYNPSIGTYHIYYAYICVWGLYTVSSTHLTLPTNREV